MFYSPNFLKKLEKRFGSFAVPNLMMIVVGAMGIVYVMDSFIGAATGQSLYSMLVFNKAMIAEGQLWRILTFLFLPPMDNLLFALLALYFYWLIGSSLEREWGSFGFTVFYLLGAIGAIISGLITGYATNDYLNMSMFLAFALLNPDYTVYVFFFLPIKMKWLALIDGLGILYSLIFSSNSGRLAIIMALINLLIFFAPLCITRVKQAYGRWKWRRNFK